MDPLDKVSVSLSVPPDALWLWLMEHRPDIWTDEA